MKQKHIILILALTLVVSAGAWAQDDQSTPPPAATAPSTSDASLSDNPPISAIDQPDLEPHSAPESFLLPGLHFSESIESNVANSAERFGSDPGHESIGKPDVAKNLENRRSGHGLHRRRG